MPRHHEQYHEKYHGKHHEKYHGLAPNSRLQGGLPSRFPLHHELIHVCLRPPGHHIEREHLRDDADRTCHRTEYRYTLQINGHLHLNRLVELSILPVREPILRRAFQTVVPHHRQIRQRWPKITKFSKDIHLSYSLTVIVLLWKLHCTTRAKRNDTLGDDSGGYCCHCELTCFGQLTSKVDTRECMSINRLNSRFVWQINPIC